MKYPWIVLPVLLVEEIVLDYLVSRLRYQGALHSSLFYQSLAQASVNVDKILAT